ncbi:hypothetical protein [Peredibacter starrii]|uniref:Uncharacterized protein n=1 Tax=Peredibacter starrii TaxID=28202 RepID=A0AAX4HQ34_9BACT|nr:hypothetical protein [Peredibacter starrii]WPU65327.1 hypothetical protein SOO65_01040 [Peredibacter starrii]
MTESDFLAFLVDETLKLQKSGEVELSSLELKLNDYGLSYLKGEFLPQSQVLRFKTSFGVLDIPINWSVFALESTSGHDVILSESNDPDLLLTVLKTAWVPDHERMLIIHADGFCYIVGLKTGEELHLHDLQNPQEWLKAA